MFSWFQTQLNMENRFVCARKGVVLSPSAAATHTRVNFVKKANTEYYKLFFMFRSFIFSLLVSFPAVWLKANLNHSSIMLECSNKEGGRRIEKRGQFPSLISLAILASCLYHDFKSPQMQSVSFELPPLYQKNSLKCWFLIWVKHKEKTHFQNRLLELISNTVKF